jgi:proteasome lid subunit RPN8/RPN11
LSTSFRLLIPTQILQAIYAHARTELPNECCGVLGGTIGADGTAVVAHCYELVNAAASPVEYLSEPGSMFRAERARRDAGVEFVAVYHSHPTSAPVPSKTDLARNYSENVMNLIVSMQSGEPLMRGWWLTATESREGEWEELVSDQFSAEQMHLPRIGGGMAVPWHRIFGMALTRYFAGSGWKVDVEVDLSRQLQRLDVVILRHVGAAVVAPPVWPDGFGTPAEYNLLTFKALQDPLNPWALKELAAHGVNYRKYVSPSLDALLPEEHFRLLAATMHFPRQLASRIALNQQGTGAYDVVWGTDTIRVLVLHEMPAAEQNLVWNLFSGDPAHIATAFQHLQPRLQSWSSLLNDLLGYYGLEGMTMPYTLEDYERDAAQRWLSKLPPEQLLAHLTTEQRLQGLALEEIEKYLKAHTPPQGKQPPEQPEQPS